MRNRILALLVGRSVVVSTVPLDAGEEWPQFRGPGGAGHSTATNLPTAWSDTQNLVWRTPLPGPGSSSPIVGGDRLYLT